MYYLQPVEVDNPGTTELRRENIMQVVIFGGAGPGQIIGALWAILALYWLVAAFGRKRAEKREPPGERIVHIFLMLGGFALIYSPDPRFGALNHRFLPQSPAIDFAGIALTAAGVAFAIWARAHLGKYWSGDVTIRQEHRLIRTGPYKYVRHPIYSGMLLALVGTVLVIGEYRAIVGFAIILLGFVKKARKEESFLQTQFGADFEEHKRLTGFFLPRFK
jgi:protein-S-isoprenylcysteine O-methyltransferase Ste14